MRRTMMAISVIAALGCGGSGGSGAAGGEASAGTGGEATASAPLVAPGQATIGDRTTCPVMGEEFVVTADSPHAEHEGRTYYFCCPPCLETFMADPARYTSGATAEPATAPSGT